MPSTTCPFCERFVNMTIKWGQLDDPHAEVKFAATCDYCEELSIARGRNVNGSHGGVTTDLSYVRRTADEAQATKTLEWWPKVGVAPAVEDVPASIARAAREAYSSASVGNHMAAILLARTVVEATARDKGISGGTLSSKINSMQKEGLIRPAIAEQAHEVRFAGNDMAHGDIDAEVDATDSEELLALMSEVLSEVFQGPARLERIRAKRQAGKPGGRPGAAVD
ncbi:DUF4145 domain-containing protein [Leifsonia sp. NPDC058292]|uniref:DUF4145 domain-containing protein n=1 Tax=Leifsonia sp. NPDC058292 TaxID=3346428 RepID=UPI0036DF5E57